MAKNNPESTKTPESSGDTTAASVAKNEEKAANKLKNTHTEFEGIYGKNPSEESFVEKCKSTSETFKDCKTYDDVKRIIKEGVDPSTRDYSGKNEELYNWMEKKVLSKEQIEKESAERNFEEVFKKQPTKAGVLKTLKERSKEYKDANTYEDAMKILEKRRPAAHRRISEHIEPDHPLQHADDATIDKELAERGLSAADLEAAKNKEIEAKKAELLKPEAKQAELKQEQPKKTSSRWSEEQENARQASVGGNKEEKPKKAEKQEKSEKEKKEKKPTHFRKNTRGGIKRLAKLPKRLRRTLGRTLMAPTYPLADIREEKKTGKKDLIQGYKNIRTDKKAA